MIPTDGEVFNGEIKPRNETCMLKEIHKYVQCRLKTSQSASNSVVGRIGIDIDNNKLPDNYTNYCSQIMNSPVL